MYDFLRGKIVSLGPTGLVLETGGVGWSLACSVNTSRRLESGGEARIWTHLVVREDLLALYGFHSRRERELFRALISVSGIGPRVAVAILSGLEAEDLQQVIRNGEIARLTAVPGVGKKTAERLVLELRGRLDGSAAAAEAAGAGRAGESAEGSPSRPEEDRRREEALEALVTLGFKPGQAEEELNKAMQSATAAGDGGGGARVDPPSVEELLRIVLRRGG